MRKSLCCPTKQLSNSRKNESKYAKVFLMVKSWKKINQ